MASRLSGLSALLLSAVLALAFVRGTAAQNCTKPTVTAVSRVCVYREAGSSTTQYCFKPAELATVKSTGCPLTSLTSKCVKATGPGLRNGQIVPCTATADGGACVSLERIPPYFRAWRAISVNVTATNSAGSTTTTVNLKAFGSARQQPDVPCTKAT